MIFQEAKTFVKTANPVYYLPTNENPLIKEYKPCRKNFSDIKPHSFINTRFKPSHVKGRDLPFTPLHPDVAQTAGYRRAYSLK